MKSLIKSIEINLLSSKIHSLRDSSWNHCAYLWFNNGSQLRSFQYHKSYVTENHHVLSGFSIWNLDSYSITTMIAKISQISRREIESLFG